MPVICMRVPAKVVNTAATQAGMRKMTATETPTHVRRKRPSQRWASQYCWSLEALKWLHAESAMKVN